MGFINCRRIFQILVSPLAAPFIPNSCLVLAVLFSNFSGSLLVIFNEIILISKSNLYRT